MIARIRPKRYEFTEVCVAHVAYCDSDGCNQICEVCALVPVGTWDSTTDPDCTQLARTLSEFYLMQGIDEIRAKGGTIHAVTDSADVKRFF